MRPDLGDVVVRARGLACHLLDDVQLRQLARSSSSSGLAGSLEDLGYWPAPNAAGRIQSAADIVEGAIDHEIESRLALLMRWLGERDRLFSPLFEIEIRDVLRIRLRELCDPGSRLRPPVAAIRLGWPALREVRRAVAASGDMRSLVRALDRIGSSYGRALAPCLREHGDDPQVLETALARHWADRARRSAARSAGPLRSWVEDEIDLQNAWSALAGATTGERFVDGGRRLSLGELESISAEADEPARRRRLARTLRATALDGVFDDPDAPVAGLEKRAHTARIAAARRAARLDPIGEAPILEVVLRLRSERASLRGIGWGIASGSSVESILSQLEAAA